jgi:pimeloyl-ACP methyl ester carboxylesterase
LLTVLDSAGLERAVILGHSAGGVVAMQFALDHPERCAGLVLVGTASECNAKANEFYETLAAMAVDRGMAPVRRRLGLGSEESDAADVDPVTFAKVARVMANLHHEPLTSRLGEIRCPTLIIVGEKDFLGAGGSVILSRNIAVSELHIVPERGHGIFLEDPKGFNELVGKFLHRLSRTLPRETGEG